MVGTPHVPISGETQVKQGESRIITFLTRDKLHRLYHQTVSQYAALTGPPVVASGGPILTQCPSVLLHNDDVCVWCVCDVLAFIMYLHV